LFYGAPDDKDAVVLDDDDEMENGGRRSAGDEAPMRKREREREKKSTELDSASGEIKTFPHRVSRAGVARVLALFTHSARANCDRQRSNLPLRETPQTMGDNFPPASRGRSLPVEQRYPESSPKRIPRGISKGEETCVAFLGAHARVFAQTANNPDDRIGRG